MKSISRRRSSAPWRSPCAASSTKPDFTQTKIHMADASYMFLGIDRAHELSKNPAAWRAIDYSRRARIRLSGVHRQSRPLRRAHEGDARGRGRQALPRHGNLHQRSALPGAFVSHRLRRGAALPQEPDVNSMPIALMYCWLLLDVEQPTFAGSRSLLAPDRTRGWVPVPTSYQLRVLGALQPPHPQRHAAHRRRNRRSRPAGHRIRRRPERNTRRRQPLRDRAQARRCRALRMPWAEIERTGLEEENAVSPFRTDSVIQPGEIVVLSTIKAE